MGEWRSGEEEREFGVEVDSMEGCMNRVKKEGVEVFKTGVTMVTRRSERG